VSGSYGKRVPGRGGRRGPRPCALASVSSHAPASESATTRAPESARAPPPLPAGTRAAAVSSSARCIAINPSGGESAPALPPALARGGPAAASAASAAAAASASAAASAASWCGGRWRSRAAGAADARARAGPHGCTPSDRAYWRSDGSKGSKGSGLGSPSTVLPTVSPTVAGVRGLTSTQLGRSAVKWSTAAGASGSESSPAALARAASAPPARVGRGGGGGPAAPAVRGPLPNAAEAQ